MKKLLALALVLMALLALTAHAEPKASIVRLNDLSISYVGQSGARRARFGDACLTLALGESDGAPTLQASFENGEGQAVDGIVQLSGQEILISVGGISGIYSIDLSTFATEGNRFEDISAGLKNALSLAGSHLDVVLYAITREDDGDMRSVEAPLPVPQRISAVEAMLSFANDMEATQDVDMNELLARVEAIGDNAVLNFRYAPATSAFELAAIQDGCGVQLSGTMALSFEPMTFSDFNTEEEKYDLMNLTPEAQEQLRGDLNMVLAKLLNYADGTGLNAFLP